MISHNKFLVLDFETNALDPEYNQPVSMAGVMIDGRKLTICEQGTFYSLINIIPDEDVGQYNLLPTDKKSLDINGITLEELATAPPLKKVWGDFTNWVKFHSPKKDQWDAPILCGHNKDYDKTIAGRIQNGHLGGKIVLPEKLLPKSKLTKANEKEVVAAYKELKPYKEPWGFGPDSLCHPAISLDTKDMAFFLFENSREPHRLSLPALRTYFGFDDDGAHNALVDTLYSAEILVRYLRLMRNVHRDTDFGVAGQTVLPIKSIINDLLPKKDETCPF